MMRDLILVYIGMEAVLALLAGIILLATHM
jgi:hypothetical protein